MVCSVASRSFSGLVVCAVVASLMCTGEEAAALPSYSTIFFAGTKIFSIIGFQQFDFHMLWCGFPYASFVWGLLRC